MSKFAIVLVAALLIPVSAIAHVGEHPSVHDTIADITIRIGNTFDVDKLTNLTVDDVLPLLTEEELHILGTQYWTFTVDSPVTVYVFRDTTQAEVPFWLEREGFTRAEYEMVVDEKTYESWEKSFPAGNVGLGPNGLDGHRDHYFVVLKSEKWFGKVDVTDMYPGRHNVTEAKIDEYVYVDRSSARIKDVPRKLKGEVLVRGVRGRSDECQLVNIFRVTDYPSTSKPDQIVLTWSDDPKTTQTVQWRTDTTTTEGMVRYGQEGLIQKAGEEAATVVEAEQTVLEDMRLVNDPVNHRFTARMTGLNPDTTYAYQVGTGEDGGWSSWHTFTTAPAKTAPFTFVYMGDAQNGLDTWGKLVHKAYDAKPEAAFYIMAGDLVNRGIERDDWDSFFHNAKGIYDRRQLVPAIGNHENQGPDGPWMYLDVFDLPKNGPEEITEERAYSFEYSNALFVVLDTNDSPSRQDEWLEEQLKNSNATWKFVVYHHPAYSSAPNRDNRPVRQYWTPLFDKYKVDLALQGHDHAYLRTYPMFDEKRVGSPAEGTVYIVSVSGTKFYEQDPRDYTEFGMTNVATYQVLDIRIDGNKLTYKAYDMDGEVRDEFVIEK